MDAEPRKKRRWFRFSLRTLFVVMTVFAFWFGWNIRKVQRRGQFAKHLVACQASVTSSSDAGTAHHPWRKERLPWAWKLLGAEPIYSIILLAPNGFNQTDAKVIAELFPEAIVKYSDHNGVKDIQE
jgi:hypothetical protein